MSIPKTSELEPLLSESSRFNPENEAILGTAVNDVYEAILEEEDDNSNEDVIWLREQRSQNKDTHWLKRPSVLMVSMITFAVAFGVTCGESSRQVVSYKLACNYLSLQNPNGICLPTDTQVLMSNLQLAYSILSGIIMLVALGKVGPMSDRYGRKVFIVSILTFLGIGKTFKFIVMYRSDHLQFFPMVFGEIISNLSGGLLTLVTLANCYISDVCEPHQRTYSLGIGMAGLFVGLSTGPMLGNLLTSISQRFKPSGLSNSVVISKSDFLPLKYELAIMYLLWCFAVFVLPESRSEKARQKSRTLSISQAPQSVLDLRLQQRRSQVSSWIYTALDAINFLKPLRLLVLPESVVTTLNKSKLRRQRAAVLILVGIECFMASLSASMGEFYILYGIYAFDWNQTDIGHFLTASYSTKAVMLIVLSPIINHKIIQHGLKFKVFKKQFDMVDFSMIAIGLVCDAIGLFLFYLAPTSLSFFAVIFVTAFGMLAMPSLGSSIIKFYPESKVGEVFGAMSLLKNLFSLVGPLTFLSIYKYSLSHWQKPGVPFLFGAILFAIALLLLVGVKILLKLSKDSDPNILSRTSSFASLTGTPPIRSGPSFERSASFSELNRKSSFSNR